MRLTIVVASLALCACAREPLDLGPAPWADGDEGEYDSTTAGVTRVDAMIYRIERAPDDGWTISAMAQGAEPWSARVLVSDRGEPRRATYFSADGETTADALFEAGHVRILVPSRSSLERPPDAIEQIAYYPTLRVMPLREGYERGLTLVDSRHAATVRVRVRVTGRERVEVPAGTFDAWRIETPELDLTSWVAVDPPHLFLRRDRPGTSDALRRYRTSRAAEWTGPPAPERGTGDWQEPTFVPKVATIVLTVAVQLPLMILFPLALGFVVRRRLGMGFMLFVAGGLTFVASQVVHLPLNFGLGLLGSPRLVALWPKPAMAAIVGLSAGLCEEVARYVLMRWVLKRPERRGWSAAVQIGVGHGGVEAMIFGGLVLLGFVNLVLVTYFPGQLALVPEAQRQQAIASVAAAWEAPAWHAVLGGVERVFAICFHVGASVLVMRAVVRRNVAWLLLAIVLHAAVDAVVPYVSELGIPVTYSILAAWAAAMITVVVVLREGEQRPAAPA